MKSNNKKGQNMIKKERQTHQDIKINKEYNSLNQESNIKKEYNNINQDSNIKKEIMIFDRTKTQ